MQRYLFLLCLLSCTWVQTTYAQYDYLLPPDRLGKVVMDIPPDVRVLEANFNSIPNYEPLIEFTSENRYRLLGSAVGRLTMELDHRSGTATAVSTCTASILSDQYIITNYHCVPGTDPDYTLRSVTLRMGFLDEGMQSGETFRVRNTPVEANHELDYAVLSVEGNPSAAYGVIPLRVRDPGPGEELFLIHHPKGNPQRLTRRNCRLVPSAVAITATELRHRCDTIGGSSGSLIFSDNNVGNTFVIVGIHFAGFTEPSPDAFNSAKRMTTILNQSPVLQGIANAVGQITLPPLSNLNIQPAPKPVLLPPWVLFPLQGIQDDQVPVYSMQDKQNAFIWGLKQILSSSVGGFEILKDYTYTTARGRWPSRVNLPQYANSPTDNCSIHDESDQLVTRTWVSCDVGTSTNYPLILPQVKAALPPFSVTVVDDERGFAARLQDGTVLCLNQSTGSISQILGLETPMRLNVWSPQTTSVSCFLNPSARIK